jgi:hypothetical protein
VLRRNTGVLRVVFVLVVLGGLGTISSTAAAADPVATCTTLARRAIGVHPAAGAKAGRAEQKRLRRLRAAQVRRQKLFVQGCLRGRDAPTAKSAVTSGDRTLVYVLAGLLAFAVGVPYTLDVLFTHVFVRRRLLLNPHLSEAERQRLFALARTGIQGLARSVIAVAVVLTLAFTLFYVLVRIAPDNRGALNTLIGSLTTLAAAVSAFYFGTRAVQAGAEAGMAGQGPARGADAPVNTSPPTISGSSEVGSTLVAHPGSWSGSPTFAYQWERGRAGGPFEGITGATTPIYIPASEDIEQYVRVTVTATTGVGASNTFSSGEVGPVTGPTREAVVEFRL